MTGRRFCALLAFTVALLAAACGGGQTSATPPVLPDGAVHGLDARHRTLSATELAQATPIPGLEAKLRGWDLRAAAESEFAGSSRDLRRVVSRTVEFDSADGAREYLELLRNEAARYLGARPTIAPLTIAGQRGYRIQPAPCGCGHELPELIAVVASHRLVTWLDISGPGADDGALRSLTERALDAA